MNNIVDKKYFFLLGMILVIFLAGCSKYRYEPIFETRQKPVKYYATETKQEAVNYKVNKCELRPPYFPNISDRDVNIAVLPFTTSSSASSVAGSGIEISNELEFRLMKHTEKFQRMNRSEIKKEFRNATDGYHVDKGLFDEWYSKNSISKYQILSRDRLNAILTEKDIKNTGVNIESIQRNAKLIGVDCLITGHLRSLSESDTSFIMKAILPDTGKVVFYERYEGTYEIAFHDAIETFFFNIKISDETVDKVKYESKSYQVEKTKYETEKVKVGTKKVRDGDNEVVTLIVIIALLAILA